MTIKNALNWLKKATQYTLAGAGIGATTGALSGTVGTAMITSLHEQNYTVGDTALLTGTGNMLLYAGIGFLEATPLSTSKIISELLHCSSACGLIAPIAYAGTQMLGGVIGYETLKTVITSMPLNDAASSALIGSPFSLFALLLAVAAGVKLNEAYQTSTYETPAMQMPQQIQLQNIAVVLSDVETQRLEGHSQEHFSPSLR